MRVLAIETATPQGSVAIVGPDGVLAERSARVPGGHLEWLVDAIAAMLAEARLSQDAIDGLVVSTGPGSFSGLRIGLMTASAWAVATGRPLVGVSTLEVIAAGVAGEAAPPDGGLVLAALDVRRGEIATALFRRDGQAARVTPDLILTPAGLRDRLPPIAGGVVVAGDALERHQAAIIDALAPWGAPAPRDCWWPRASIGGALGRARLLGGDRDDPLNLAPRYAREPDARELPRAGSRPQIPEM